MTEGLKSRIERVALCADLASHYVQDMRVMPAEGVKMVQRDALARIETLEHTLDRSAAVLRLSLKYNTAMHGGAAAHNQRLLDALAEIERVRADTPTLSTGGD
jgi:hypothetical protein